MWAQLVKFRVPSGSDEKFRAVNDRWEEQVGRGTDSGWQRTLIFRSASDPTEWYEIVYFESEEKARANERSAKHLELVGELMALAGGEPDFVDLTPVSESSR